MARLIRGMAAFALVVGLGLGAIGCGGDTATGDKMKSGDKMGKMMEGDKNKMSDKMGDKMEKNK